MELVKKTKLYVIYSKIFGMNKGYLLNKDILNKGSVVRKNFFKITGVNNDFTIGNNSRFENNRIFINGSNNKIVIGDNCRLLLSKLWIEGDNNLIFIGNNFKSGGPVVFAAMEGTKIVIGNDNLFAFDIELRTSDGHSILDDTGNRMNIAKDIIIGNENWVGKHVTFLKGSKIGNYNVVGYGSVLTKSIEGDHMLILGFPASCKRQNINWRYEMV